MKRRVNFKYLATLFGILVVLGGSVHLLHGYQVRRNASVLLTQADKAEQAGEADKAVVYLVRYLSHVPDDTGARARLGLLLARQARTLRDREYAFEVLDEVLRRDPARADVRRRLVQVAMSIGRFSEARDHLEKLLADEPDDPDLRFQLGQCHRAGGDYAKARPCFEAVIRRAPDRIGAYAALAALLRDRLKQPVAADRVMQNLIEANKKSFRAYLARARYRQDWGLEGVEEDVRAAQNLEPTDAAVILAVVDLAEARGDLAEARAGLENGLKRHPKNAAFYARLARLDALADRVSDAVARLRKGLEEVPGDQELTWLLANLLIDDNQLEEAAKVRAELEEAGFPPAALAYADARVRMKRGEWPRAAAMLERARPQLPAMPQVLKQAELRLGECYGELGDRDRQLAAYRRSLAADPSWVPGRAALAAALLEQGRVADALGEYRQLMAAPRAPREGWLLLAKAMILYNEQLPPSQQDWPQVDRTLARAEKANPGAPDLAILKAQALAVQGRTEDARKILERVGAGPGNRVEAWAVLLAMAQRKGDRAAARAVVEDARKKLKDTVDTRLLRARFWADGGGSAKEAGAELLRLEEGYTRFPKKDQGVLLEGLLRAHLALGAADQAERLGLLLAGRYPQNLRIKGLLFDLALTRGDEAAMQKRAEEIKQREGEDGAVWRYCEAARLVRRARGGSRQGVPQARRRLTEVGARRPGWAKVPLLEAELDEAEGKVEQAITHYQRALEQGDRQPAVVRRLVRLLYDRRRYAEAEQALLKLQDLAVLPTDLRRLAAEVSLQTQGRERALELARQAVPADSKDYRDHVWLGQILWAAGKNKEAEEQLRKAVGLGGNAPDAWVALVGHLARTGQKDRARAEAANAEKRLDRVRDALALAQCREVIGDRPGAERYFRAALKARPEDPAVLRAFASYYLQNAEGARAVPLLRTLADGPPGAAGDDVQWARRSLALTLAAGGSYKQFLEARHLLEENAQRFGKSVEDERARAAVLATRPSHRTEAINLLEKLSARRVPTPDEKFLLVQLYEAEGHWPQARDAMQTLLNSQGNRPFYIAYYVRNLVRHNEPGEARLWVDRLAQLEPGTFRTVSLQARVLRAENDGPAVLKLLQDYLRGDHERRRVPVASLLDELGQSKAAEELFREEVARSKRPERVLVLAQFLGRHGNIDEALDLCERAWKDCKPDDVATVTLGVLNSNQATPDHFRRVEKLFQAALGKNPNSLDLMMSTAQLYYLEGRYPESEGLYRSVLDRDRKQIVALNNRAWLLALHAGQGGEAQKLVQEALDLVGPVPDLLDARKIVYPAMDPGDHARRQFVPDLLDTRAVIQLMAGRSEAATRDLEDAIRHTPTASRYFHLAQAYDMAGNPRAAGRALAKADELGIESKIQPLEQKTYDELRKKFRRGTARSGRMKGRSPKDE